MGPALPLLLSVLILAGTRLSCSYSDCADCGVCQALYMPVCGSDGVSYHNACHLGCEKQCKNPKLKVKYGGECGHPVKYY